MDSLVPTRVRWILVVAITLMVAIFFVDRVNVSITGHLISQDYSFSDERLGKIFSAFFFGYAFLQIPAGWVVDRLGPRRVLAYGALWWAVFTAMTASLPAGFAHAFVVLWLVRFSLGAGESVVFPSSNRWVANWIPTADRGLANGLIFAGVGAGSAFAPPLIRYLMVHFNWRTGFWGCAVLGLLAASVWYWMARDRPDEHPKVNEAERNWIIQGLPKGDPEHAPRLAWSTMLASKDVWALTFSYFCFGYSPGIYFTWFFNYLTQVRGLNLKTASYYSMLPFLGMSIGSVIGGWIADKVSRRLWPMVGTMRRCGLWHDGSALFLGGALRVSTATTASVILAAGAGSLYVSQSAYLGAFRRLWQGFRRLAFRHDEYGLASWESPSPPSPRPYSPSLRLAGVVYRRRRDLCVLGAALWLIINPNLSLKHVEDRAVLGAPIPD